MYMYVHCNVHIDGIYQIRLACIARLIWPDWKWSVVVKLYRRVCTMSIDSIHIFTFLKVMSIHIFRFMNMYVPCTYKYIHSWTCMFMVYTFLYIHAQVHIHSWMNIFVCTWYQHVGTIMMFRQVCTVLLYPLQVVRIPDEPCHTLYWRFLWYWSLGFCNFESSTFNIDMTSSAIEVAKKPFILKKRQYWRLKNLISGSYIEAPQRWHLTLRDWYRCYQILKFTSLHIVPDIECILYWRRETLI